MPPKKIAVRAAPSIRKNDPWRIRISDEDLAAGTTPRELIEKGIKAFHQYGFVIIENSIPHNVLDKYHDQFMADIQRKIAAGGVAYNHGNNTNFSFSPPLSADWIDEPVWANVHAIPVIENIIGPKPQLAFISSNINMPQAEDAPGILRQAVHADPYGITHEFTTLIESFIFTRDTDVINGSTEIWPGSHTNFRGKPDQNENGRGWIKKEVFTERAKLAPPLQPFVPKGSICIRDIKIWHAGMPNFDDSPRIMLALMYFANWFDAKMKYKLPEEARAKAESFERYDLVGKCDFVPGPIDNLDAGMTAVTLNFTQDSRLTLAAQRNAVDLLASRMNPFIKVSENDFWTPPLRPKMVSSVGKRGRPRKIIISDIISDDEADL